MQRTRYLLGRKGFSGQHMLQVAGKMVLAALLLDAAQFEAVDGYVVVAGDFDDYFAVFDHLGQGIAPLGSADFRRDDIDHRRLFVLAQGHKDIRAAGLLAAAVDGNGKNLKGLLPGQAF